jgi:hypothetical protein
MAGKEIDVDILQLLIQHDTSIRGSNSRTGRDRGCLWELAFSQSASFHIIKLFHELNPDSIRKSTYSRSLIQLNLLSKMNIALSMQLSSFFHCIQILHLNSIVMHCMLHCRTVHTMDLHNSFEALSGSLANPPQFRPPPYPLRWPFTITKQLIQLYQRVSTSETSLTAAYPSITQYLGEHPLNLHLTWSSFWWSNVHRASIQETLREN